MKIVQWTSELELGIPVIDKQHRRIVDAINELVEEQQHPSDSETTLVSVMNGLIDYTYSHFAFEESLMEEAGYEYLQVHQQTHKAFTDKIDHLSELMKNGEDIRLDIAELLQNWLVNHIMEDDRSYADAVKRMMPELEARESGNWVSRTIQRFFG